MSATSGPRPFRPHRGAGIAALTVLTLLAGAGAGAARADPGVDPKVVVTQSVPGGSFEVTKTVHTPPFPPRPDVVLLVDTTDSMVDVIADVQANLAQIIDTVTDAQPDAQFAVASYRDITDEDSLFQVHQDLTDDGSALQAAVNGLSTGGGGDEQEDWINALFQVSDGAVSYRPDSNRIVVLVGDAPSHDPSNGHSVDSAISALQDDGARVVGVDVQTDLAEGLDSLGQAGDVVQATDGQLLGPAPEQVSAAILTGLGNLDVTVTPDVSCDPGLLDAAFEPAEITVPAGTDAVFTETITVSADVQPPMLLHCDIDFLIDGQFAGVEFNQTVAVEVMDDNPPVVVVEDRTVEATGPDGATVSYPASATDDADGPLVPTCQPPSGATFPIGETLVTCTATDSSANIGSDTATMRVVDTVAPAPACTPAGNPGGPVPPPVNPDGFYRLTATDVVDAAATVRIRDTGDPAVDFGPFPSGTRIKLVQAPGAQPQVKPGTGEVDYHVRLRGDALVVGVDGGGNISEPVTCVVPPHPKS